MTRVRWLTHTGRQVSPSGLKPNSLTRDSPSDAPRPTRDAGAATMYLLLSPKIWEPRNTPKPRKQGINGARIVSVCSVCSVVEIRDSDSVPRPLAKRVGSIRQILRLQPLGIKSFVFEPPLTQRLCVAFWIASAVQHSIDDHSIVYDPIPNNEREP